MGQLTRAAQRTERVPDNAGHGMGISENPPAVCGAEQPGSAVRVQELSSALLLFLSAVCLLTGQLQRVGTVHSDETVLLITQPRCWLCGAVLFWM